MQCDSSLQATWQIELAMHRAMLNIQVILTAFGCKGYHSKQLLFAQPPIPQG